VGKWAIGLLVSIHNIPSFTGLQQRCSTGIAIRGWPERISVTISIVKPPRRTTLKFILFWSNTLHFSDGLPVRHQESKIVHIRDAACAVLDSWWWTERPSETCRMLFQNKINLRCCASGWFYYRNILRCTVLQTSNFSNYVYGIHASKFYIY
jgi:hypothetical protein